MTQAVVTKEVWPSKQSDEAAQRQRDRTQAVSALAPMAPIVPGDKLPATGIVGAGSYRGGIVSGTLDLNCLTGAVMNEAVTFNATGIVRGLRFNQTVALSATASVVFNDCRFYYPITVASGGKVTVQGSVFDGTSAILNAGLAADAGSIGNLKLSATAHTNTTVIFEV